MNRYNPFIFAVAASLLAVGAIHGQATGTVKGYVLVNGASPLAGAMVAYSGLGSPEPGPYGGVRLLPPRTAGAVKTGADGSFTISALPQGWYVICATGTLPVHIGSCTWDASNHEFSVLSGQTLSGLRLNIRIGAILDIAITDPTGCVANNRRAPVYVFQGAMSKEARMVSSAGGVFHYQVPVPQQVPLAASPNHACNFADPQGNAITKGVGLAIPPAQAQNVSVSMTTR